MESERSQSAKKATGRGRGRGIRCGGSKDPGGSPLHNSQSTSQAPQSKVTSSNSPPFNFEASSPPAGIDQYADTPGNAVDPRGIFSGSTVSAETSDPVYYPPKDQYGPTGNAPDARLHAGEAFQKSQANAPAHPPRGRSETPVGKRESRLRFPSLPSDLTSEELAKIVAENCRLADDDVRVEFSRDDAPSAVVVLNDGNAAFKLWKRRLAKNCLTYKGERLTWDIDEPTELDTGRFLLENAPDDITSGGSLLRRLRVSDVALKGAGVKAQCFQKDDMNFWVVFTGGNITADDSLMKVLNDNVGAMFTNSSAHTRFRCIEKPRHVTVTGLSSNSSEDDVTFLFYEHDAFVQEVTTLRSAQSGKEFLVTFRKQSDAARDWSSLDWDDEKPCVKVHDFYPTDVIGSSTPDSRQSSENFKKTVPDAGDSAPSARDDSSCKSMKASASKSNDEEGRSAEIEELLLKPDDDLDCDTRIIDFVWNDKKRRRKLERAVGRNYSIIWDADNDCFSIKPKPAAKEEGERWKEDCADAARDFFDDYKILEVSVGPKFWKTIINSIGEDELGDGVSIHKEATSFVISVVGEEASVSSCVRSLKLELKQAEKTAQEEESIVTKYVKASNAENLRAFLDSNEFASFCKKWSDVDFRANDSRCAIEIECQQKIAEKVRESLETVVSGFQTEYLSVSQHLHTFFLNRGFERGNALLSSQGIQVKIIAVDKREHRLKAAGNPADFSKARNVLLTSYQAVQINVDDVETQEFLSTAYFASFVEKFARKDVVLIPSLADMARAMVTGGDAFVVGSAMDAAFVAKQVNEYLKENVIYSITLDFPTSTGRFLQEYKWNALMAIKNQLKAFSAEIKAVPGPRYTLELSANRDGLQPLRREIDNAARSIKETTAEVKKYGLYRFIGSESYVKEKSHLEGKYSVILATDQDKEPEPVFDAATRSMVGSEKKGEFRSARHPGKTMALFVGDLCRHPTDAIVNAANEDLQHSGGLARHIAKAAGVDLQNDCRDYIRENKKLPTGQAMRSKPGQLKSTKHVFHAVGPRWPKEFLSTVALHNAETSLKDAVRSTLLLASKFQCKSVAFPAISSGIFGCPIDDCAKNMIASASEFLAKNEDSSIEVVQFVMRPEDNENVVAFEKEMRKRLEFVPPKPVHKPPQEHRFRFGLNRPAETAASRTAVSPTVTVVQGTTTDEKVDIVVNSTNGELDMYCALAARALSKAAGPRLQEACTEYVAKNGRLTEGDIAVTDAYNLPAKKVLHVWCPKTAEGLKKLVVSFLIEASRLEATSVSIPALGTGRLGLSDKKSAQSICQGITDFYSQSPNTTVSSIRLVVFDKSRLSAFKDQVAKLDINPKGLPAKQVASKQQQRTGAVAPKNIVTLLNGSKLTVETGDIATFNADVIVVPVDPSLDLRKGIVAKKIHTLAGPNLQAECNTKHPNGIPVGEMVDLPGSGGVKAKHVFALACPRNVPPHGARDLKSSVVKCLAAAEAAGVRSIAIPALGTGNLGFSNSETATAIFQAAIEYSQESVASTLQNIYVLVFDAPRLDYFMAELRSCFPKQIRDDGTGGDGGGFGSKVKQLITNVVGSVFGSASKKDPVRNVDAAKPPDTVVITVLGEKCHDAFRALKDEIGSECITETVDVAVPENLDEEKLMQLQTLVLEKHVVMTFKAGAADASPEITLSGWKEDTRNAMKVVVKALSEHWKTDKEAHVAEVVAATNLKARVSWYWLSDTGYREYSPQVTIQIEDALVRKEKTVITVGKSDFEIDAAGRKQISINGGNIRKIKREDVSDGIALPSHWDEIQDDKEAVRVHVQKDSSEFNDVAQTFLATAGGITVQQIVSIVRIQNPRIYKFYAKEKDRLEKKRATALANQGHGYGVEWNLWHGTSEEIVQLIVTKGFNRSYAGKNVGKKLGQGVYFAKDVQYSARPGYAVPNPTGNQHMFLCRVLAGLFTVGSSDMVEPPPINAQTSVVDTYDSTVDNVANPRIFASCFIDHYAYPDYLIAFNTKI